MVALNVCAVTASFEGGEKRKPDRGREVVLHREVRDAAGRRRGRGRGRDRDPHVAAGGHQGCRTAAEVNRPGDRARTRIQPHHRAVAGVGDPQRCGRGQDGRRAIADADGLGDRVAIRVDPHYRVVTGVGDPYAGRVDGDRIRAVADGDCRRHQRHRVDAGDRAVGAVRHPERPRAGRDRGRIVADVDRSDLLAGAGVGLRDVTVRIHAFQEYPSAHSGVSSAAASVLAAFYGNATPFTVTSAGLPGTERHFTSFAQAVQQVEDARIYAGFHFRFSTADGAILGARVARYVTATLMQPEH